MKALGGIRMKGINRKKFYFIMILMFGFFFASKQVQASTVSNTIVEKDKIWVIKFNRPIDYNDKAVSSIGVFDKKGEKVNIRLQIGEDKKSVIVKPPIRMYTEGEEYVLKIETNIQSEKGNKLKEKKEINFTINKNELYKDYIKIKPGDIIQNETGKNYIFYDIHKSKPLDNKSLSENGWSLKAYKTVNSRDSRGMIYTLGNSKPLELPFKVKGWMGVYVGYHNDTEEFMINSNGDEFKFKNYNDNRNKSGNGFVNESFIFAKDFSEDNSVTISAIEGKKAQIAYIRLVPLNEEEIALYNKTSESSPANKKTVVYDNDGYTDFFLGKYPDVNSLEKFPEDITSKLNSQSINWTLGTTGLLNYNSQFAGTAFLGAEKFDQYVREGDILARYQILNILNGGKSPLELVANRGENLGVSVNASLRMNAFYKEQSTVFLNGAMYDLYKDCLQNNNHNLSYYYPKYRTYILNILKEVSVVENVDGVTLDFCRYPNVMGSEATLGEKIAIMNEFMRQVRLEIPNKKITVRFPYLQPDSYGLDVKTWVEEGLVDTVVPSVIGYEEFWNVEEYSSLYKSNKIQVLVGISANLKGRDLTPETEKLMKEGKYVPDNRYLSVEEYLIRANEAYSKGADGIFMSNILNDLDIRGDVSPKFKFLSDKFKVKKWHELEYKSYLVNDKIEWIF